MIYIYGITRKSKIKLKPGKGIHESPIQLLSFKDISAIITQLPTFSFDANQGILLQHASVVEAYFKEHAIIPFRFGTVLDDPGKVYNALEERYMDFNKQLTKIENKVEFGLKVSLEGSAADSFSKSFVESKDFPTGFREGKGPGVSYLLEKYKQMGHSRSSDKIAETINKRLCNFYSDNKRLIKNDSNGFVDLVYLVPCEKIQKFKNAVKEFGSSGKFLLTGPWPPYNFVSEEI